MTAADIVTLCVFRSDPPNVAKVPYGQHTLSDRKGKVYEKFNVKGTSTFGAGKELMRNYGLYKQHMNMKNAMKETGPFSGKEGKQASTQLPADFLIDENGIIVDLFRAKSPQDHMPLERLENFIPEGKRCNCNKKDCISSKCRETYEEIRKENEAMFGGA